MSVTDDTRKATAYSERERKFTFVKIYIAPKVACESEALLVSRATVEHIR